MARSIHHARQFKHRVLQPGSANSREILKWLYTNLGQSSASDLHNGVWYFHAAWYGEKPFYYFKNEQDAVYFKMTWE